MVSCRVRRRCQEPERVAVNTVLGAQRARQMEIPAAVQEQQNSFHAKGKTYRYVQRIISHIS